jgi:hypothetical protein
MGSNVLNMNRFRRYFRSDLRAAVSNYGITFLVFSTLAVTAYLLHGLFFLTTSGEWYAMSSSLRIALFVISGLTVLISSPAKLYGHLTDRREGSAFLMVPVSSKYLAGKEENVKNLFNACVKLMPSHYSQEKNGVRTNFYEIQNKSDLYFELELTSGKGTQKITLYPMSSQLLSAEAGQQSLSYDVTNAYVRSDKFLNISFSL